MVQTSRKSTAKCPRPPQPAATESIGVLVDARFRQRALKSYLTLLSLTPSQIIRTDLKMTVVTRFAPSPTGYLHLGGGRTALFNWLFARNAGGKFLLRIEDTDRARSTDAAVEALLQGLNWLGLDWDEDPVMQFSRMERHAQVAKDLVEAGKAYYCYTTPEELETLRAEYQQASKADLNKALRDRAAKGPGSNDAKPVIRIRAPEGEGDMLIKDLVQGDVKVPLTQLDDMVLLRSDGTPTYMLSVVVDDHDMGITHVIRGDDHLVNSFRQRMIYDAMGWALPTFAHIPMILGPDGAKLSKRHGAVGLHIYQEMGYLPEAMRNYLLRLGWGHGDTELISTQDAIKLFSLEGVGKSPSRMDFAKLAHVNAHYIKACEDDRLIDLTKPFIERVNERITVTPQALDWFRAALPMLKERAQTLVELADASAFFFYSSPLPKDEKAASMLAETPKDLLQDLHQSLLAVQDFSHENIEAALKKLSTEKDLKLGKIAMPLRAAITGSTNSPSVFHIAEILGKDETLKRLSDAQA